MLCPNWGFRYCNRCCQKTHWGQGGHRKYCTHKKDGTRTASPGAKAAHLGAAAGSGTEPAVADDDGPECVICLDSAGEVLQRGCHCRGDAGLAHVRCLAQLAAHGEQTKNSTDGWWTCGTPDKPMPGARFAVTSNDPASDLGCELCSR